MGRFFVVRHQTLSARARVFYGPLGYQMTAPVGGRSKLEVRHNIREEKKSCYFLLVYCGFPSINEL